MTASTEAASALLARSLSQTRFSSPSPSRTNPLKDPTMVLQPCIDVICCDADHSSTLPPCSTDCLDCPISTIPTSPCSDIHHISSACTEPTCAAASSSTSPLCSATAVACCDDTACEPVEVECCDDVACEKEEDKGSKRGECRECKGAVTGGEGGKMYSSFQELLDCCCCSLPSNVGECCVEGAHHNHHPPPSLTPSSTSTVATNNTITSNVPNASYSRSTTISSADATPQPSWLTPVNDKSFGTPQVPSFEDIWTDLQSWNDCIFPQPHLHSSVDGGCLPPAMTLCSREVCDTSAPHSHWDGRKQICQWAGCSERFWTVEELVAHVNHSHLGAGGGEVKQVQVGGECLWDDCHQGLGEIGWVTPSKEQEQQDKFSLAILQHLLQDHLGQQEVSAPIEEAKGQKPREVVHVVEKKRKHSPCSSSSSSDNLLHCRWEGCSATFSTHSSLTSHIEEAHVGSGKSSYSCRWAGCPRFLSGTTFSQKQKVLRHIQTHTGDKPFKCPQCGNRFSESNTLAQHLRTHTLEKPYVCDHPGCGKAFSVAGSLTIHKRTHTGSKPFQCGYEGCGKRFSESSNLVKHMRTHSGVKEYVCEEQGCGKRFSRPDQLARHRATHEKKRRKVEHQGEAVEV